ncbi:cation:proton antiporter [Candidatus Woesearchaeota archaeon]|nr:cation:proton antiporter [Candidatus Woesearchaeota archaeon]
MGAIEILTWLSLLLLLGIVLTYLSNRLKIPNVLVLIIAGIVISLIRYKGEKIVAFSNEFLTAVAIIALIMIVFDSTSRLNIKSLKQATTPALKVTIFFIILELIVITVSTKIIFNISWFIAVLFSTIVVGTDPSSVIAILKNLKHRAITFLEIESIINTPLTVILPFVVIEMSKTFNINTLLPQFVEQVSPLLQQIITGVGAGMVVGLIVFKAMEKQYSEILSPVTLISSALLTYILAETLGGNGVLAVTTLGIFFGNIYLKKKRILMTFGSLFSNLFEILVFLFLGLSIVPPTQYDFYLKAFFLFIIYIGLRTVVVLFSFPKKTYAIREKLFIALNTPKGVAVAVVAFTLLSLGIAVNPVIDLALLFILYSVILSTFTTRMSKYFLGVKQEIK